MKKIYTIHNNMNLQWFIMVLAIKLSVPKVIFLTFESGDIFLSTSYNKPESLPSFELLTANSFQSNSLPTYLINPVLLT